MTVGQARELLGLAPDADAAALGCAYRAAVKAVHPDLGGGDPERLRQVIEAHRLLKSLGAARVMFAPVPRKAPSGPRTLSARISLGEAMAGGRRRLTLPDGQALQVRLPKGLRGGDMLRLRPRAGAEVLVRISLMAEPGVTVRGGDLWLEVSAVGQVRPGARLEVDTPRGRRALTAPEGMAEGKPIRLKGQGLPARGRHAAGDLILRLKTDPAAEEPVSKTLLRRFSARWAA